MEESVVKQIFRYLEVGIYYKIISLARQQAEKMKDLITFVI
jgi:hypothetical protein